MNTGVDPALLDAVVSGALDPLAYWGALTGYGGFAQNRSVRAALEIDPAFAKGLTADLDALGIALPPLHAQRLAQGRRFIGLRLPLEQLPTLATLPGVVSVMPGFIGQAAPALRSARLRPLSAQQLRGRPAEHRQLVHRLRALQAHGPGALLADQGPLAGVRPVQPPRLPARRGEAPPLIGVVDFGCAFLHPALVRPGPTHAPPRTRILRFWDQGRGAQARTDRPAQAVWPWQPEATLGYGRVADASRLDALVAAIAALSPVPLAAADARLHEACYVAAELPELLEPSSHGTAVLGLAAGRGAGADTADAAAAADILFVQLPQDAVQDLSGGWLSAYLLDALAWLEAQARELGRRLIVNLSLGTHAGPHDGSSLLERVLDDHAARDVLVLAAGNAGARRGHAQATLPAGPAQPLHWLLPERDPTQSFVELWYRVEGEVDALEVEVGHRAVATVRLRGAGAQLLQRADGSLAGAVVHVPPGTRQPSGRIWMALAPTLGGPRRGAAPAGRWTLALRHRGPGLVHAHAWVERDEPGNVPLSDRPDSVLEAAAGSAWHVSDCMTLTAQASAPGPVVVGGLVRRGAQPPLLFRETGLGPTRGPRRALDAWAPADERIRELDRGLVVLGNHSTPGPQAAHAPPRLRGTSLAAPQLLRWLYGAMVADPTLHHSAQARARVAQQAAGAAGWNAPQAGLPADCSVP